MSITSSSSSNKLQPDSVQVQVATGTSSSSSAFPNFEDDSAGTQSQSEFISESDSDSNNLIRCRSWHPSNSDTSSSESDSFNTSSLNKRFKFKSNSISNLKILKSHSQSRNKLNNSTSSLNSSFLFNFFCFNALLSFFFFHTPTHVLASLGGEAFDVKVRLYNDQNCFEQNGERTFSPSQNDIRTATFSMDSDSGGGGSSSAASQVICYGNIFSNVSYAFDLAIVRYYDMPPDKDSENPNSFIPRAVNLRQYIDHCRTTGGLAPLQARVGQCTPFLGPYYAIFSLLKRSQDCTGKECSPVQLVRQEFYVTTDCQGTPYITFKYPIKRECMRYYNGTQTFEVDPTFTNITERDYEGDRRCQGVTLTYNMKLNYCYQLYGNNGFKWIPDDDYLNSNGRKRYNDYFGSIVIGIGIIMMSMLNGSGGSHRNLM